ncbi:MAG: hypothetical protein RMJ56_15430 [Gemmataceae bacterium]|nr:hypothetical protein [Gemmata sp.]MDW8198988.1 hypothetical protein [Gemmataceae bacterium]
MSCRDEDRSGRGHHDGQLLVSRIGRWNVGVAGTSGLSARSIPPGISGQFVVSAVQELPAL